MKYIQELREGERLSQIFFCKNKTVATTKAGKTYYSLSLQDKTGVLDAKVWELSGAIEHFENLDFIKIDGDVTLFNGSLQLNCRRIRKAGNTPVMMLTAKGETFDKVLGLELGADDYMVKPFDAKEVVARIKAVLRRCQTTSAAAESTEGVIEFDNLRLDMNSYELRVKGKVVEAPPKELELLNCLASHPNRVYTRDQLLDEVWGFEYYGDSRTIDVHVKRLREKLAGASDKWELKTVWGVGYKFEVRQ